MLKPATPNPSGGISYGNSASSSQPDPKKTDMYSMTFGTLSELQKDLKRAIRRTSDTLTKYHLEDCYARIKGAMDND